MGRLEVMARKALKPADVLELLSLEGKSLFPKELQKAALQLVRNGIMSIDDQLTESGSLFEIYEHRLKFMRQSKESVLPGMVETVDALRDLPGNCWIVSVASPAGWMAAFVHDETRTLEGLIIGPPRERKGVVKR